MTRSTHFARLARWALLAAPVLMAGALFATVWATYRGVEKATDTIVRGQADILHDGLRREIFRERRPPTDDELAAALELFEEDGLVHVVLFNQAGERIAEAGKPGVPGAIRSEFRAPGRRRRPMDRGGAPRIVIDFVPRSAADLRATAKSTLAIGMIGAGGFLVVALVLVRWLLQREAAERRLAHERRLASLGEMSAVLAHEIRNPLASLKGNAQLLARGLSDSEKTRAKADLVVKEAVRLEHLTNDLLEFARSGELRRADVDPVALLTQVTGALDLAGDARVDVEAEGAPATWRLDAERMRQVLSNLVENALQAGDGRVAATVRVDGGRLCYLVRDHGPGIPPGDLERIFDPFVTGRTSGTGLGLAVARRLVELHGGTLTAANAAGGGAAFTVSVPRS